MTDDVVQMRELGGELHAWPEGLQAIVLPGVVGQPDEAYPPTTSDIVKRLRRSGLRTDYRDPPPHRELVLHAAEWWFPFILFTRDVIAAGGGQLLVEAIMAMVGKLGRGDRMHIRVGMLKEDGRYLAYEMTGPPDKVLEAIRRLHE